MQSFIEHYLSEEDEFQSKKDTISIKNKEDLSKVKNEWLKICFSWLFAANKDLEAISFVDKQKERQKYFSRIALQFKGVNSQEARDKKVESILNVFEDGPLFVPNSIKPDKNKDSIDFLWYADDKNIDKSIQSNFPIIKKIASVVEKGSSGAHYPFAYYRIELENISDNAKKLVYSDLKAVFGKDKEYSKDKNLAVEADKKAVLSTADVKNINVSLKCLVDFTVKMSNSDYIIGSKVKNADTVLETISDSALPIKKSDTQDYNKYDAFGTNRKSVLLEISKDIESSSLEKDFDRSIYSNFFSAIANCCDGSSNNFDLNKFKKQIAFKDINFGNFLKETRYYGSVMSELFVPFVLLAGFTKIDGKNILRPTDEADSKAKDEEVLSIEYPKKSNEKLRDYNCIFANTKTKRYAISAKFGGNSVNHTSLLALVKENSTFKNSIVKNLAKNEQSYYYTIDKVVNSEKDQDSDKEAVYRNMIVDIASKIFNEDGLLEDYKKIEGWKPLSVKPSEKFKEESKKLFKQPKKQKQAIRLFPYSLPVVCDFRLADFLNKDDDFLKETYKLVFEYYGEDVEFEQLTLMSDFSIKYITKNTHSEKDPILDKIEIVATSLLKQPAEVKNTRKYPFTISYIPQPLHVVLK